MLFQPSNIYPSTFSGIGAGTVDVTQGLNVSWQVNGDTPMTAYQIKIYQNDSGSTLMYDSGSVAVSPAFEPHDKYGNATYFTAIISAAALSSAGIVNGYQYGYKMLITQWWGVSDYVEQTSASVFITRSTPTLAIDTITTPVASSSLTITATYSQAQGDPISTVEWVFALAGSESTPIRKTGAISTQVLSFDVDGLITGNTYSVMCNVVTSNGMEASTGFVQFAVSYSSSSLGINYQLAQLKNSSAVYLSWDDLGSNILSYPYTDTTKTTNGITFTVNGEGDIVATGTASSDAYFTIAEGTTSQLGITAGKKFVITSGYSGSKIVITETNGSNVVVSTIEGSDPLQYIATSTTNTLKFSIVIPSGAVLSSGQQLKPMIALEDKIVAYNDVSVNIEPTQDLHGYSNPWPAGGGKNKLNPLATYKGCSYNAAVGTTLNPVAADKSWQDAGDDTFTISNLGSWSQACLISDPLPLGKAYVKISNVIGAVKCSVYVCNGDFKVNRVSYNRNPVPEGDTIVVNTTFTNDDTYFVVYLSGNGADASIQYPYVYSGDTAETDSFSPYSNICPISGRTGLSVYRTGKNLVDMESVTRGYFVRAGNVSPGSPLGSLGSNASWSCSDYITVEPSTVYTQTLPGYNSAGAAGLVFFSAQSVASAISGVSTMMQGSATCTFATPSNCHYMRISWQTNDEGSGSYPYPQLEKGSKTTYEPYNGNTYSVDWSTQAGTVYGGTLNLDTGVLTVDMAKVVFDGSSTTGVGVHNPLNGFYFTLPGMSASYSADGMCNMGKTRTSYGTGGVIFGISNNNYAYFTNLQTISGASDVTGLNSWLTTNNLEIEFVYPLATPLTYQLTAQEIAVLVGTNNVWSNAANVTVTYTKESGTQATLNGSIVTFNDSNAQIIPTPQFVPGITGISIYRYLQGESALQHVYDLDTGATSILDYYAPSQMKVSYLIVAHSSSGDLFLQTTQFTPTFWFYSILLCDTDSNGDYHVSKEYIFKYGVETGAVSNNNTPTIQRNFTPYPNRQPISSLYKTGKLTGYIGKVNSMNRYSDSVSLQNAIYDISVSVLTKFLKTRKGDVIMVDTASPIQMKTDDNTVEQSLAATVDWIEMGDADGVSIVSVPTDTFWPI